MNKNYLESVIKQFLYYKMLADKTIKVLNKEEIHWQSGEESNSIAILVKHMVGNMLSRWTNLLTEDGEKEWRNRDAEFEDTYNTKEEMIAHWEEGWNCLFNTLNSLHTKDLERIIFIRNQGHTVLEAINRQLTHYPYHIGQIVYIGKLLKGGVWESLSIAKGQSTFYNSDHFGKEKERKHFTDDL